MSRRSFPHSHDLWHRHVELYCEVFLNALFELTQSESIFGDETEICRRLCPILRKICFEMCQSRNIEIKTPTWEGPIAPATVSDLWGSARQKRPDFTCGCTNRWAESPEEYEIPLHVECKRLGRHTSVSWKLNENYVTQGIKRFDSKTHEYGKRAPSGIMIGYVINMELTDVLDEINKYQKKHLPDNLPITFSFEKRSTFKTLQKLQRREVFPSDFELIHIWADIREKYVS